VTTRTRNPLGIFWLRHGLGSAAARPLRLGMLGFRRRILASPSLSACGLPSRNFALAKRVLAVTLVPLARDVSMFAPFTQAQTRSRASHSGTAAVILFIVVGAHGSRRVIPKGSPGRMLETFSPGVFQNRNTRTSLKTPPKSEQDEESRKRNFRKTKTGKKTKEEEEGNKLRELLQKKKQKKL